MTHSYPEGTIGAGSARSIRGKGRNRETQNQGHYGKNLFHGVLQDVRSTAPNYRGRVGSLFDWAIMHAPCQRSKPQYAALKVATLGTNGTVWRNTTQTRNLKGRGEALR